jgi:hypothetical protein
MMSARGLPRTRSRCSVTCRITRSAGAVSQSACGYQRESRGILCIRWRLESGRGWSLFGQPLYDGDCELQHAGAPARVAARRQRLDRLLGPLWSKYAAVLRFSRATRVRAGAVHGNRSESRSEDADAHARVERRRSVCGVFGECPLEAGSCGVHRAQRPGFERQLSLRRR